MINLFCIRPKAFNIGNDAIFSGLRHLIRESFGTVVNLIQLPATSRYESQAQAGFGKRTVHEMNQYGHGVIVGGGNLYENGEIEVDLNALQSLEPPLLLFSLSMGRIYNNALRLTRRTDAIRDEVARALNEKAAFTLARDSATLEYLQRLGIDRARLGGCPTTLLGQYPLRDEPPAGDRNVSWISVRTPELMNIPLAIRARVANDVRAFIRLLRERGHDDIRILCHDHRDIPFAASFGDVEYVYTGDVDTYLGLLRHCRLLVTYRLHAALPAMAYGRPFINLSYDERGISTFATHGLGAWNIDIVQEDSIAAVIDRLDRLDELSGLLESMRPAHETLQTTLRHTFSAFADRTRSYAQGNA